MTRYLVVTDDATPADIREAITNLRDKQRRGMRSARTLMSCWRCCRGELVDQ